MSIKKGSKTIASSVPATEWGSIDGNIADQADLKQSLDDKASLYSPTFTGTPLAPTAPVGSNNNQIATTRYVQDAILNAGSDLPDQTGHAGQYLTTDGELPSWATVDALPSQIGKAGRFLKTNGTIASWDYFDESNLVHKTSDEVIDGTKTFLKTINANSILGLQSVFNNITRGTAPSNVEQGYIVRASDKNSIPLGGLYYSHYSGNNNALILYVYDPTKASGYDAARLVIGYNTSGQPYTSVFTPTEDNTTSTQIDTVGERNTKLINYVTSREENLVTNGSQFFKSNYNWSTFTYDGSDENNSSGCIKTTTVNVYRSNDEYIPIDISKGYTFSFDIKTDNASARFYDVIYSYDSDNKEILNTNVSWIPGTTTTLTQDLNTGDTVIHLTDVSGWNKTTTTASQCGVICWNYKNNSGYTYPKETYSRNLQSSLWTDGNAAINTSNNTITLTTAWSGPNIPAGTFISQSSADGNTRILPGTQNYGLTPNTWTHRDDYIEPSQWKKGTAYVRVGWTLNRNVSSATTKFTNISFTQQPSSYNTVLKGIPTAPTASTGTNTTQIATTAFVQNTVTSAGLSGGADISIDNKVINYTGNKFYKLATRTWTYAQWIQYCDKGVTTTVVPSYTVTGIKAGDLVSVEGICSDRNNSNVLAWGVVQALDGNNVSVTFLGLNIQNDADLVHISGTETITGEKTFNNTLKMGNNKTIRLYNSDNAYCEIRSNAIEFMPTASNTNGGYIDFHYAGSTSDYTSRIIESASGQLEYIGAERYTATNATNNSVIATKGWVNNPTASTNVVHRTGDETIAGTKTFSSPIKGSLDGGLYYVYAHNGNETNKYYKLGECTISGTNRTNNVQIMIQQNSYQYPGITFGELNCRVGSQAGTFVSDSSGLLLNTTFNYLNSNFDNLRLYYTNNYGESSNQVKLELWVKVNGAWEGWSLSKLDSISSGGERDDSWKFTTPTTKQDNWPTGHTGYIVAKYNQQYSKTPTDDTTSSQQVDTVGARNTKLGNYQLKATYDSTNEMLVLA